MPLLLLCVVLQALSLSQGLNRTDDRTSKSVKKHADHSDKQIELSTLSLSEGCFGVPRALYKNTTVDVTLNLLNAQEKKELALQICERLSCGGVFEHGMAATVHNGTCLADCILRDSKLHNCTTAAKGDCMNATEVICESVESRLISNTTELNLTTLVPVSTAMAATESSSGVSAAAIGCIILSIALLMLIILNAAAYVHFKRAKGNHLFSFSLLTECVIHQNHTNSHTSLESQSNVQTGICNTQTVPSAVGHQYESLGPRMSSKYGSKFSTRTNRPTHDSDSSTDSDYEYHNSNLPQRLHLKNSRYGNDVVSTSSGERRGHNVEINMDTIQKSGDKPPLAPLSFGAPEAYRQAVDMNDTSSTSSGEFYQNTKADTNNTLQSRIDMNDSSSTSSGEFYQNIETNTDNNFMSREERQPLHETSPFAPLSYGDHHFPNTDSQDVKDSDSTSSGECYQNTEIDMDKDLQCEDEESPSLPEKSLKTPHSAQMTGNTADYSSSHVPFTHNQDGNDSDSTSSEECYQNTEMDENAHHHYGEESPSLPEMSFQNPHIAQMTESTDGYGDHHVPKNLSQDNSSTASEASYVNVPPKKEREDNYAASSESDYDEPEAW
ncbi:hypothetical protein cypCar_00014781 [Cyprinus carpio]|nr:hypothetical protein cypCar_00014781 [Cyprinus carpio]